LPTKLYDWAAGIAGDDPSPGASLEPSAPGLRSSRPLCAILFLAGINMNVDTRNPELAPCGVFCGACPSFEHTCFGCPSEDRSQKRTSKWSCRIRRCCYETKNLNYCIHCTEFPCKTAKTRLLETHNRVPRFAYRHEIVRIFPKLIKLGEAEYHQYQIDRWVCPNCGGRVFFYEYRCRDCEKKDIVIV